MLSQPLRIHLLNQVEALRGLDFQQAVVELLYLVYTHDGFTDLREVRDGGCDGLIQAEQCSIACYGPEHHTPRKLRSKLEADYAAYARTWRDRYPRWRVYVNWKTSPEEWKIVQSLHPEAELWGSSRIIAAVESLSWDRRIKFGRLLQIDDSFLARDFLRDLLDDLVAQKAPTDPISYAMLAPGIRLKIEANYPPDEVDIVDKLVQATFEQQQSAEIALSAYDDADLNRIKTRIIMDFEQISGVPQFGDRIRHLRDRYIAIYNQGGDDGLNQCIQGLLFLLFTQCLIGRRPVGER
jgi:hypothetical protein